MKTPKKKKSPQEKIGEGDIVKTRDATLIEVQAISKYGLLIAKSQKKGGYKKIGIITEKHEKEIKKIKQLIKEELTSSLGDGQTAVLPGYYKIMKRIKE